MGLYCAAITEEIRKQAERLTKQGYNINPVNLGIKLGLIWEAGMLSPNENPSDEYLINGGFLKNADEDYGSNEDNMILMSVTDKLVDSNNGLSEVKKQEGKVLTQINVRRLNFSPTATPKDIVESIIGEFRKAFGNKSNRLPAQVIQLFGKEGGDRSDSLIQTANDAYKFLNFVEYEYLLDGERANHYSEPYLNKAAQRYARLKPKPNTIKSQPQPQATTSTQNTNTTFVEEPTNGYRNRTIKNAKADATIAFAIDFNTAGERLTKNSVIQQGKKYIPIDTNNPEITDTLVESIVSQLNEVNAKSINIAGNGIYTLKDKYTQEQVDNYVYELLSRVLNSPNLKTPIATIRSGGQTGYDEAGIKAAQRLGIVNGILAPKGWAFRDINGKDIYDEQAFKSRFSLISQNIKGENISSKGSEFAKRLTNPFNKETVEFRGTKFDNAEHAYQTWKSGKFDQKGYDAHGGKIDGTTDYNTNYQTMVEIITAKLQQHPDLVQGIDERGGLAYLNNSTHNVIGDEFWEKQGNFMKALTEAYNRVKSMPTKAEETTNTIVTTRAEACAVINKYIEWQDANNGGHVRFDEKNHKYYIKTNSGQEVAADYSVTQFEDLLWNKESFNEEKYGHTGVIGTQVDRILRDCLTSRGADKQVLSKDYPNFPAMSRQSAGVVNAAKIIVEYLDSRFGKGKYKVYTKEFYLTGRVQVNGQEKTIAGTMDMLVVDEFGKLHIFDFKTKSRDAVNIDLYNEKAKKEGRPTDRELYTFQLNAYRQLIEATMPELEIGSMQLIWLSQELDKDAKYTVEEDKTITVSKGESKHKLAEDAFWETPKLGNSKRNSPNEITNDGVKNQAIIPIGNNNNDTQHRLNGVKPYSSNWRSQVSNTQNTQQVNTQTQTQTQQTNTNSVKALSYEDLHNTELATDKVLDIQGDSRLSLLAKSFNAEQRRNRALNLSNLFTEIVTRHVEEYKKNNAKDLSYVMSRVNDGDNDYLSRLYELVEEAGKLDSASEGRKYVISQVTVDTIFSEMLTSLREEMEDLEDDLDNDDSKYYYDQISKTIDNFELLMRDASAYIQASENVKIDISTKDVEKGNGLKDKEYTGTVGEVEDENKENELNDDDGIRAANGNDGWNIKTRFTNPMSTLSHAIKAMLAVIPRVDSNGTVVYDDLGKVVYLPSEYCHAVLISGISQLVNSPDDFVTADKDGKITGLPALEKLKAKYPWVQGVINYIYNSENPMRIASQFFTDLRMKFIPYYKQFRDKDGVLKTLALNKQTGEESALNRAIANYEQSFKKTFDVDGEKIVTIYGQSKEKNEEAAYKAGALLSKAQEVFDRLYMEIENGETFSQDELENGELEFDSEEDKQEQIAEGFNINTPITPEEYEFLKSALEAVFGSLGFEFDRATIGNMLTTKETAEALHNAMEKADFILKTAAKPDRNLSDEDKKKTEKVEINHLIDFFKEQYKDIAAGIGTVLELENVQSFRDGDKTRYSYSTVNYFDTMFDELFAERGSKEAEDRKKNYLYRQYGQYEWFKEQKKNGQWKNGWLREIENGYIGDVIEITNIEGKDYADWEPLQIKAAFIRQFYSIQAKNGKQEEGWFNAPIFANSPVCKFIKFKLVGDNDKIIDNLCQVAEQELWRMRLVENRAAAGVNKIANFDYDRGRQFCFLPKLNYYRVNPDGSLVDMAEAEKGAPTFLEVLQAKIKTGSYKDFLRQAVKQLMEENFKEFLTNNFEYTEKGTMGKQMTQLMQDILNDHPEFLKDKLDKDGNVIKDAKGKPMKDKFVSEAYRETFEFLAERYFYEQAYASTQIIQLTTTDLAYYASGTDFQKRYKELYASGKKLNTNSQFGRKIERTAYFKDMIVTSRSFSDIKRVLRRAVAQGNIKDYDMDNILNKFKDINVADAQAYRNLDSMKAILDMIGQWDDKMETALKRIKSGNWNMEDFNLVWQTIKPFVYTQIEKPDGLGGVIKVPHQNKNSEFLILAFYNTIASPINSSPTLRAIDKYMEDNEIDVMQFESAVKAGKQGAIDLSYSEDKLFDVYKQLNENSELKSLQALFDAAFGSGKVDATNTANWTYSNYKDVMDYMLDNNLVSQEVYNDYMRAVEPDEDEVYKILSREAGTKNGGFNKEVIHEIPYEDYVIQQPTPEHLVDHDAVFGSQFRNLIISDMPDFILDSNGNKIPFTIQVNGKEYTKDQIRTLYQSIIIENLLDDWKKVKGKFADIYSLRAALKESIEGSGNYNKDLLNAIEIVMVDNPANPNEKEAVFNIPLDNPSTTEKLQQITNSMFKNAIQKQTIKGGACILVSNFGLTSKLKIRFKKTKEVIENGKKKIVGDPDGGIEGIECYLPASSRQHFEAFMIKETWTDDEGKVHERQRLDINKMPEDLRKIIGYRIPTEDKYSMAPLIVMGFLPQQNGSSIMLPADITQIAGSDFDVDKMFLMIPEFKVYRYDYKKAKEDFADIMGDTDTAKHVKDIFESKGADVAEAYEASPDDFKEWFKENKHKYQYERPKVRKVKYDGNKKPQEQSRDARNNMLIDISYAILQHPDTAQKILNPGSFDKMKTAERIATITNDKNLREAFAEYMGIDKNDNDKLANKILEISDKEQLKVLNKFLKKYKRELDPLGVDTFIYNHVQNMTGDALIGMYANNTSMQAKYQASKLAIKDSNVFHLNGRSIKSLHSIFSEDAKGNRLERISKNCANGSAASVDNVKDPVLAGLMQNTKTANICGFMLRAGMSWQEIGLLFSQPTVRKCVRNTGDLDVLGEEVDKMNSMLSQLSITGKSKKDTQENSKDRERQELLSYNFTSKELLMNILDREKFINKWQKITEDLKGMKVEEKAIYLNDNKDVEFCRDYLNKAIKINSLMVHIVNMSKNLSDATQISRADSPNGAIKHDIAGARAQIAAVERYNTWSNKPDFYLEGTLGKPMNGFLTLDMTEDQMREKLLDAEKCPMPMLQAFYSFGIDLAYQTLSKYYIYTQKAAEKVVRELYNNTERYQVYDDVLKKFYTEMLEWALTKTDGKEDNLFGGKNFEQKRKYYLYEFPSKYLEIMDAHPEIRKISIFKKITVKEGNILFEKSGRLTPLTRETLMRDMDMLLYLPSAEAQQLAVDLFMYAFYKTGLKFGATSFGMFFSTSFLTSFPAFINKLRSMRRKAEQDENYFDGFLEQFYANHFNDKGSFLMPYFDTKDLLSAKEGEEPLAEFGKSAEGEYLKIKPSVVFNENAKYRNGGRYESYKYIKVYHRTTNDKGEDTSRMKLYKMWGYSSLGVTYREIPTFTDEQKDKRGVIYNGDLSVEELAKITVDKDTMVRNASINSKTTNSLQGMASADFDPAILAEDENLEDSAKIYADVIENEQKPVNVSNANNSTIEYTDYSGISFGELDSPTVPATNNADNEKQEKTSLRDFSKDKNEDVCEDIAAIY